NPNYYAFYISLVILFCIYNIIKSETERLRGVYIALIPLNLLALYLTECRTTYIVLLIVCPIMLAYSGRKKWLAGYLIAVFTLITLILLFGDTVSFLPRVDQIAKDLYKRIDIWSGAIGSIMDAPLFGRGYNTYARIHDLYGSYSIAKHAHNLLLELLMDFGFVGTTVLMGYFSINVGKIIRLHKQNKCHQRYALTITVIVSVLLHGLLDITMLWPQTSLLIMYVVGFSTEYDKEHIFSTSRRHEILSVHTKPDDRVRTEEPAEPIL
ncbi:MAG: O-antigen ligase family protein, partial [Hominenteromicrobium sp.]